MRRTREKIKQIEQNEEQFEEKKNEDDESSTRKLRRKSFNEKLQEEATMAEATVTEA